MNLTSSDLIKFAASFFVILCVHLFFRQRKTQSLNKLHFKKIGEIGSLGETKEVDFLFYFPTRQDAENASKVLRKWEFKPVIVKTKDQYTVEFSQKMTLNLKIMDTLSEKFSALAEENHGEFDGWGCEA